MSIITITAHVTPADAIRGDGRHGDLPIEVDLDRLTAEEREALASLVRGDPPVLHSRQCISYGPKQANLPVATHDAVVDVIRGEIGLIAEEERQQAERRAESERQRAERRAEAEQQAQRPAADQVVCEYGSWRIVYPLREYEDLCAKARAERERRIEEAAAARAAEKEAEKAEREAEQARRHTTLAAVVARHLPDLSEAWDAGELCEREPVQHVTGAIRLASRGLPGDDMPRHRGTVDSMDVDCLPAGALRVRAEIRAALQQMAGDIAEDLELPADLITIAEGPAERTTPYRPATEEELDDPDLEGSIDGDGDLRLPRVLRLPLRVDVGGVVETVYRVLAE